MKRHTCILLCMLGLYFAGYAVVRWKFHSTAYFLFTVTPDSNAKTSQEQTCIPIPDKGLERGFKKGVYWLFYPMGQFDKLISGRAYETRDARGMAYEIFTTN